MILQLNCLHFDQIVCNFAAVISYYDSCLRLSAVLRFQLKIQNITYYQKSFKVKNPNKQFCKIEILHCLILIPTKY